MKYLVLLLAALVSLCVLRWPHFVCPNVALYLQSALRIRAGQIPYVEFFDTTAPFVIYFYMPALFLATLFNLTTTMACNIYLLLFTAFFTGLFYLILNQSHYYSKNTRYLFLTSYLFVSLYTALIFAFGQREHLFILTAIPYFFMRFNEYKSNSFAFTPLRLLVAFAAYSTSLLKPQYFIITLLTVEVLLFSWEEFVRSFHVWIGMALAFAIYAFQLASLPSTAVNNLFYDVLPMVSHFDQSLDMPLASFFRLHLLLIPVALSFLWVISELEAEKASEIYTFALVGLIGFAAYCLQMRDWAVLLIPMTAGLIFVMSFFILFFFKNRSFPSPISYMALLCFTPALFFYYPSIYRGAQTLITGQSLDPIHAQIYQYVSQETKLKDQVLVLSLSPSYEFPMNLALSRRHGSRYISLLPLVYANRNPADPAAIQLEKTFVANLHEDIASIRPKLIFIVELTKDDSAGIYLPNFKMKDYIAKTSIQEVITNHYQNIYENERMQVFKLK